MNRRTITIILVIIALITLRILINLRDQTTLLSLEQSTVSAESLEEHSSESISNEAPTVALSIATEGRSENDSPTEPVQVGEIRAYSPETDTYYSLDAFNQLDKEALMTFRGVGEVTADAILKYREEHGPFKAFSELMEIKGIGEKKLAKIISENP